MSFWLWFGVAIALPIILPIAVLSLAWYVSDEAPMARHALHPLQGLKDGQLLYVSVVLAFAGVAEAVEAESRQANLSNVWFIFLLCVLVSVSLFLLGRAAGQVKVLPIQRFWPAFKQLRLLKCSLWITLFTVITCIVVHVQLLSKH